MTHLTHSHPIAHLAGRLGLAALALVAAGLFLPGPDLAVAEEKHAGHDMQAVHAADIADVAKVQRSKPDADAALALLKQGNGRFIDNTAIHPNGDDRRRALAASADQADYAYATVLTCSDSRVPVELIFDAGVMELFVIRVAGNVADVDEIGTIEYGLAHVKTPLLVVMGHTSCGAVKAVCAASSGDGHELERMIPPLVDNIGPAVERTRSRFPHLAGTDLAPHAVEENVWQSIEDLFRESPATRQLVLDGEVQVVGAVYDLATGRITWLDEHKPYLLLGRVEGDPTRARNAMYTPHEGTFDLASRQ